MSVHASATSLAHQKILQSKNPSEVVLQSFNTWAFKREQPSDLLALSRVVQAAVAAATPIAMVLYWGRGPRSNAAGAERSCLDFLGKLTARVEAVHAPGVALTLILTDTHTALNGYPADSTDRYFTEICTEAGKRGFQSCHLSGLVSAAGGDDSYPAIIPGSEILAKLTKSAAKWNRSGSHPSKAALDYYMANMREKRAVEIAFPKAIFVTFNGSDFRELFPASLPIFYMYSLRRGVAVKPWFEPDDASPCDAAPRLPIAAGTHTSW